MKTPWTISIAFNYHDSSVALAYGNEILKVLEAERIFAVKKLRCSIKQMNLLISLLLKEAGIRFSDVDIWCGTAFGNKYLTGKYPEVRETAWRKVSIMGNEVSIRLVNHHRAHAAFFYASPFKDAAVISCDGGGDSECNEIFWGKNLKLERQIRTDNVRIFSSTFYDRASYYLYGKYRQEGKFMGLAAWEEPDKDLQAALTEHLDSLSNLPEPEALKLLGKIYPIKNPDFSDKRVRTYAATVQKVFEEARINSAKDYCSLSENLVLAGGSALNITANTRLIKEAGYRNIWVPPNCDDTGQAVGALLDTIVSELNILPEIKFPYLGRGEEPKAFHDRTYEAVSRAVQHLLQGKVLVWHIGRAEVGPRALGHRSLLAAPFSNEMRILVSELIKRRENYRPVAPVILEEDASAWFDLKDSFYTSPYMSFGYEANDRCCKLAPAVVHVDGSSRAQTVSREDGDPLLRLLISSFKEKTGIPILINTSLNGPGMPICDKKEDSLQFIKNIKNPHTREKIVFFFNGNMTGIQG